MILLEKEQLAFIIKVLPHKKVQSYIRYNPKFSDVKNAPGTEFYCKFVSYKINKKKDNLYHAFLIKS